MMKRSRSTWLLLLSLVLFSSAYVLDDQNKAVQYYPTDKWKPYYIPDQFSDWPLVHLRTFTYSVGCIASLRCTITIPFKGSGITVYNVIRYPLNVTVAIDGRPSQSYLHNLFSCIVPDPQTSIPTCYGHPTINLQCLPYGNHVLELTLVAYNTSQSDFYLDWVDINETKRPCGQHGLSRNAKIAIGTCIVAVSLVGIGLALHRYHRGHRPISYRKVCARIKPESQERTLSFQIDEPLLPQPTISSGGHASTFVNSYPYQLPPGASPASVPTVAIVHSRSNTDQSEAYGGIVYEPVIPAQEASTTSLPSASAVRRAKSTPRLTDAQMESIQRLLNQNVPLGVVANLMESMMNASETSSRSASTRAEFPTQSEMTGPPMYESQ